MLWDTAGQEEFDAITKAYYRGTHRHCFLSFPTVVVHTLLFSGAHVCVVAFSTVDRDSFLAVEDWKKKVLQLSLCTLTHITVFTQRWKLKLER